MKLVPLNKCELDVVECDCGYHLGLDATFVDQVGDFITVCPSCGQDIDTGKLYEEGTSREESFEGVETKTGYIEIRIEYRGDIDDITGDCRYLVEHEEILATEITSGYYEEDK